MLAPSFASLLPECSIFSFVFFRLRLSQTHQGWKFIPISREKSRQLASFYQMTGAEKTIGCLLSFAPFCSVALLLCTALTFTAHLLLVATLSPFRLQVIKFIVCALMLNRPLLCFTHLPSMRFCTRLALAKSLCRHLVHLFNVTTLLLLLRKGQERSRLLYKPMARSLSSHCFLGLPAYESFLDLLPSSAHLIHLLNGALSGII